MHWVVVQADYEENEGPPRAQFEQWYDDVHLPELVSRKGFSFGARLGRVGAPIGAEPPAYLAAYGVDDIATFEGALRGPSWGGAFESGVSRWSRSYFEVRACYRAEPPRNGDGTATDIGRLPR